METCFGSNVNYLRNLTICVCSSYRNGTAFGGELADLQNSLCDFEEIKEGKLEFGNGETSKEIKIRVNLDSKVIFSIIRGSIGEF